MKKRKGFTLIEIVVVVAATGLIMTSIVGIVLSAVKAQNRTKSYNKVVSNGTFISNELKRNVLGSSKSLIGCSAGVGTSVIITSFYDGETSNILCNLASGRISSSSAERSDVIYLSGTEVVVTNCNNFVSCSTLPSGEVSSINFNFDLRAITAGVGVSQNFEIKAAVRN